MYVLKALALLSVNAFNDKYNAVINGIHAEVLAVQCLVS